MKSPLGLDTNLPVVDLVKEAIALVIQKRQILLQRFLPILLLMTLLDVVAGQFFGDGVGRLPISMINMLLSVVVATAAHRMTLCPQQQMFSAGVFGRPQRRYLLRSMLIGVFAGMIMVPGFMMIAVPLSEGKAPSSEGIVAVVACIMVAIYVASRLMITLPEIALGRETSFARAWQMSKGNGSRMAIVVVILPLVMMIPAIWLMSQQQLLLVFVGSFVSYVATLVGLVTLSLAYQFLAEFTDGPGQGGAAESDQTTDFSRSGSSSGGFDA
ncbi:hypothetical protein [Oceanobacter mangrovi]|uniref:hypothetical protein n=1 Tax=Oceanobacter mangrovi TaxID=2862510 RepID=UPI001C8F12E7|nr:hypothetical protein [Oceanobacter mangrovi]